MGREKGEVLGEGSGIKQGEEERGRRTEVENREGEWGWGMG